MKQVGVIAVLMILCLLVYAGLLILGMHYVKPITTVIMMTIAGWQIGQWITSFAIWVTKDME